MRTNFLGRLEAEKNSIQTDNIKNKFWVQFRKNSLRDKELKKDVFIYEQESVFTQTPIKDDRLALLYPIRFIAQYSKADVIDKALRVNPNISNLLEENHLSKKANIANFTNIAVAHLIPTAKVAQRIYCNMGHGKNEINYLYLTQAALLHDIGKIFIPSEILDKKGRLTSKERDIVQIHNLLSSEILKTTNLHPLVAKLALEHHNHDRKVKPTQENQALTIADVYCALREKRAYKKPLNDICAKTILYSMGADGVLDSRYIQLIDC